MTPEEVLHRANSAQRLLEDPLLKDSLAMIERDLTEAWHKCPVRDVEGREELWRLAVTARKFKDILQGTMESGKVALKQMEERKSFMDRAKAAANGVTANWRR